MSIKKLNNNYHNLAANSPTGAAGSLRFRGCAYRKIRCDPEAADPAGGTPQPELKFRPWEYCKRTHPPFGSGFPELPRILAIVLGFGRAKTET